MSDPPGLCGERPLQNGSLSKEHQKPAAKEPKGGAIFPQRRRGRPPGRPNLHLKDEYSDNPDVQRWNAAKSDKAVPAVAVNIRDALPESYLVRDHQRVLHQLPSRETILFVEGWISNKQIAQKRQSYINSLLIHSRGEDSPASCVQCADKRSNGAVGPFLTCRVLKGGFFGACSNCKWFDTASACSLFNGKKPNRKRKNGVDDGEGTENGTEEIDPAALNGHVDDGSEATACGVNGKEYATLQGTSPTQNQNGSNTPVSQERDQDMLDADLHLPMRRINSEDDSVNAQLAAQLQPLKT